MKKNNYHILHSWILLICFVAGQYMVFAHQHLSSKGTAHKVAYHTPVTSPQQTVTDNCQLCDAMHHNTIAINNSIHFAPVVITSHIFRAYIYAFKSIAIIHSGGRSPPLA